MNVSNNCQVRQVSKSQLSKSFDDLLANASWSPNLASFKGALHYSDSLIKPDLTSSICRLSFLDNDLQNLSKTKQLPRQFDIKNRGPLVRFC